jgi:hypothetical protein
MGPWPKGINLIDPVGSLDRDTLTWCSNWRLDPTGRPFKRPGNAKFGSSPAKVNGDALVNFLFKFYDSAGNKTTLAAAGGKLFKLNDSTGISTQININNDVNAVMNSVNLCSKFVYKDRVYILDGTGIQRYDGTTNLYAGFFVHTSTGWTLTPATSGGLLTPAKVYQYILTSVQGELGEGIACTAKSITLGATEVRVTLTNLDIAPAIYGQTTKRLYRTAAGGSIFYFLAELDDATTSYVDILADSALGDEYVSVHQPRVSGRFACMGHDSRAYYCGFATTDSSLVEVSDVGFPDRIIDGYFFTVANRDGDSITGCARVPSGVVFFKNKSTWLCRDYGTELINVSTIVGCNAPFSITEVPGGILFLAQDGEVYFTDGVNLNSIGRSVKPEFVGLSEAAMNRVVSCYHDLRYIISYDKSSTKGYNSRTLEFETVGRKWDGPHENGLLFCPSYYSVWDSKRDAGELLWGEARATTGSYVYKRTAATMDDQGTKSYGILRTGYILGDLGSGDKLITKGVVTGRGSAGTILRIGIIDDLRVRASEASFFDELAVIPGASSLIWGIGRWGVNTWGGTNSIFDEEDSFGIGARGSHPVMDLIDGATALSASVESIDLLVDYIELK